MILNLSPKALRTHPWAHITLLFNFVILLSYIKVFHSQFSGSGSEISQPLPQASRFSFVNSIQKTKEHPATPRLQATAISEVTALPYVDVTQHLLQKKLFKQNWPRRPLKDLSQNSTIFGECLRSHHTSQSFQKERNWGSLKMTHSQKCGSHNTSQHKFSSSLFILWDPNEFPGLLCHLQQLE